GQGHGPAVGCFGLHTGRSFGREPAKSLKPTKTVNSPPLGSSNPLLPEFFTALGAIGGTADMNGRVASATASQSRPWSASSRYRPSCRGFLTLCCLRLPFSFAAA